MEGYLSFIELISDRILLWIYKHLGEVEVEDSGEVEVEDLGEVEVENSGEGDNLVVVL